MTLEISKLEMQGEDMLKLSGSSYKQEVKEVVSYCCLDYGLQNADVKQHCVMEDREPARPWRETAVSHAGNLRTDTLYSYLIF